jgi:EpsI family protein
MRERTSPSERPSLGRRKFILGGTFLASAGLAAALIPRREINLLGKHKLEQIAPNQIGPWTFHSKSGLVVPPSDELSDWLYSQLLTRVYVGPEQLPIMLLIAQSDSQSGVLQVHRPEVCYPAGGYQLSPPSRVEIPTSGGAVSSVAFSASADTRVEQLLYWTRIGRDLPRSWREQRWAVAQANLRGEIPDAVLVRVSTLAPDLETALPALRSFSKALVEAFPAPLRPFLTGFG